MFHYYDFCIWRSKELKTGILNIQLGTCTLQKMYDNNIIVQVGQHILPTIQEDFHGIS